MAETSAKRIAIIGSANPDRNSEDHQWRYDPPLENVDDARAACRDIGAALCAAGWDIVVYAGEGQYDDEGFIEPPVVQGYLSNGEVRQSSIHVFHCRRCPTPEFTDQEEHTEAFDVHTDLSEEWEPSFYRSLAEVDGALILGGGSSAYLAGLVCLGHRIPTLALAGFGAGGSRVHRAIVEARVPLSRADLELLAKPDWEASSATDLVASLETQRAALDAESNEIRARVLRRRRSQSASLALGLFVVASLLVPTALVIDTADTWLELALLFAAPIVAGAAGGTVRTLLPRTQTVEISTLGSAALGAVAGGISGLLYLMSQVTSSPDTSLGDLTTRQYQTWVLFAVVIGFVAGIALDAVFQRLITAGAAQARDI